VLGVARAPFAALPTEITSDGALPCSGEGLGQGVVGLPGWPRLFLVQGADGWQGLGVFGPFGVAVLEVSEPPLACTRE
jgi:hypothetical protein